jgi:hypothetical protein|nr:MAG TPA: hypothetical protein [Caudoviricetes sp.]
MALGDNNYKKNNDFHPTVYGYQFSNSEAKLDQTSLTFNWWNKMLKVSIAPKMNNNGDYAQYDHKNAISVYMGVQSAKALYILMQDYLTFLSDPVNNKKDYNRAIQVKSGVVILSNGKFIGQNGTPCMVIAKINDKGKIESSYAYEFKIGTMYSIDNFNAESGEYETSTDQFKLMEIELVANALKQYVDAVSNMIAASVVHEMQPFRNEIRKIADKLGVSLGGDSGNTTRTSYFNNQSGASESNPVVSSTLDEIENI